VISYCVVLDVPSRLGLFMSGVLGERHREIGTRSGTGALSCWRRAVFALAWFRDRPGCGVGCVENIRVQKSVAASPIQLFSAAPCPGWAFGRRWQPHLDGEAAVLSGCGLDVAGVGVGDGSHDGQSQAGTAAW
jgi:hypothetical protein